MKSVNDLEKGILEKTIVEFYKQCKKEKINKDSRKYYLLLKSKITQEFDKLDKEVNRKDIIYSCISHYDSLTDLTSITYSISFLIFIVFTVGIRNTSSVGNILVFSVVFIYGIVAFTISYRVPKYRFVLKVLKDIERSIVNT